LSDILCQSDELQAANPNAKVILPERDTVSRMTSMDKILHVILGWTSMYWVAPFEPV